MGIRISNLSKTFLINNGEKRIDALLNIHLEVEDQEFICLVGPSGCGKSTLLKILAGLEAADEGLATLDEEIISKPDPDRGMIFQEYALFPWRTVRKNVEFGLEIKGYRPEQRLRISQKYLALVGLLGFADAYPHQLSGGMKQRVAIARSLSLDPKILLMDEPFGALDAFSRLRMQEEITRIWNEEHRTVVFVTHDIDEAIFLGDRVVVMTPQPGRIKSIIPIGLGRPRNRNSHDFLRIRDRVYAEFALYNTDAGESTDDETGWGEHLPAAGVAGAVTTVADLNSYWPE
ncbi:MAG: ABC transporter ATP-binding protein [Firmicutes bacterium]|nr:ABC transporter ATP-binding protein [Bacillota bacterium]